MEVSPTKSFTRKAAFAIMTAGIPISLKKKTFQVLKLVRPLLGGIVGLFLVYRLYIVLIVEHPYGPDTWTRLLIAGLILGGVYSLIAIGYTLVYGILFMINFAHGDVMMLGAFGGYFVFEALNALKVGADPKANFLNTYPIISIIFAFIVGMVVAATMGYFLEKIAYRPLRKAPRLVPLDQRDWCFNFPAKCSPASVQFTIAQLHQSGFPAPRFGLDNRNQQQQCDRSLYRRFLICPLGSIAVDSLPDRQKNTIGTRHAGSSVG